MASHPVWVRGLKLVQADPEIERVLASHPVWVRGLKLQYFSKIRPHTRRVAPRVGAWIET